MRRRQDEQPPSRPNNEPIDLEALRNRFEELIALLADETPIQIDNWAGDNYRPPPFHIEFQPAAPILPAENELTRQYGAADVVFSQPVQRQGPQPEPWFCRCEPSPRNKRRAEDNDDAGSNKKVFKGKTGGRGQPKRTVAKPPNQMQVFEAVWHVLGMPPMIHKVIRSDASNERSVQLQCGTDSVTMHRASEYFYSPTTYEEYRERNPVRTPTQRAPTNISLMTARLPYNPMPCIIIDPIPTPNKHHYTTVIHPVINANCGQARKTPKPTNNAGGRRGPFQRGPNPVQAYEPQPSTSRWVPYTVNSVPIEVEQVDNCDRMTSGGSGGPSIQKPHPIQTYEPQPSTSRRASSTVTAACAERNLSDNYNRQTSGGSGGPSIQKSHPIQTYEPQPSTSRRASSTVTAACAERNLSDNYNRQTSGGSGGPSIQKSHPIQTYEPQPSTSRRASSTVTAACAERNLSDNYNRQTSGGSGGPSIQKPHPIQTYEPQPSTSRRASSTVTAACAERNLSDNYNRQTLRSRGPTKRKPRTSPRAPSTVTSGSVVIDLVDSYDSMTVNEEPQQNNNAAYLVNEEPQQNYNAANLVNEELQQNYNAANLADNQRQIDIQSLYNQPSTAPTQAEENNFYREFSSFSINDFEDLRIDPPASPVGEFVDEMIPTIPRTALSPFLLLEYLKETDANISDTDF